MRKLVIGRKVWEFQVGSSYTLIKPPGHTKKIKVSNSMVKGINWGAFERGQYKKTTDGMVTPGEVSAYIENNLIADTPNTYLIEGSEIFVRKVGTGREPWRLGFMDGAWVEYGVPFATMKDACNYHRRHKKEFNE